MPQALGAVASFLVGVAGNVVSDDMGYRWTPVALAGLMLIRGLWRAAGPVVTVVGVLFLTTAGLALLSGGPPVPALVFGQSGRHRGSGRHDRHRTSRRSRGRRTRPACVVDGLETAAHGYTLGGVLTLLAGAGLLIGGGALLWDPAVALWQRAKAAP